MALSILFFCRGDGMADMRDSKSRARKGVRVRLPLSAQKYFYKRNFRLGNPSSIGRRISIIKQTKHMQLLWNNLKQQKSILFLALGLAVINYFFHF